MKDPDNNIFTLLEAISAGDHLAFRQFYDLKFPQIYRFVHYFLSNPVDCDETVSEVFCQIWQNRHSLCEINNLNAYLYVVCRNEAYRCLRHNEKYANISIDEMPVGLCVDESAIENELITNEMISVYNKAINTLPERCKLIFLMVREEKLRHKEIAQILSITEGTIEQQMNIAIKKIISVVKAHYPSLKL